MNTGIKHIELWVSNLEQGVEFYKHLFSLIGWQHIDANGFSDSQTKIYLVEQPLSLTKGLGPRHICFLADSEDVVNKVGDWLMSIGADMIRGPLKYEYKGKQAYTVDFKDPDGYILEVATKSV